MAGLARNGILLIAALSFLSLACADPAVPEFQVEGEVYCEVCRVDFINKFSQLMPGAKVKLECRGEGDGNVTFSVEGDTNNEGLYSLTVKGDHDEEECEITLVKSGRSDCEELPDEGFNVTPNAKVTLTKHNGVFGSTRHTNPLAFTKKEVDPACQELLKQIAENADDDE